MLITSMELLLNLFWLLVALASFGLWRLRWSRASHGPGRGESLRGAVSLCCVLVLLFFAISLTDDLHAIPAVAEEKNSSRQPLQAWKASSASEEPGKHAAALTDVVVSSLSCLAGVPIGRVVWADAPSPRTTSIGPFQGRAPPSAFAPVL